MTDPDVRLAAFRDAITTPAYRAFLEQHRIDVAGVRRAEDVDALPLTTKDNYIAPWSLLDRLAGGWSSAHVLSRSSGSSGKVGTWPRSVREQEVGADLYSPLMIDTVRAHERTTLCIVGFSMGAWIAGTYTQAAMMTLAARGASITTVTPGMEGAEITALLREVAPGFDQTVLFGYPPFVRGVLEDAVADGLDLGPLRVTCAFSGEGFTERFRDRVCHLLGRPDEPEAVVGVYGAADTGLLGTETPATIALRRRLHGDPSLTPILTGGAELPAVFCSDPRHRATTVEEGMLVYTLTGAMPLVRYVLGDAGVHLDHDVVAAKTGIELPAGAIGLLRRVDVAATMHGVKIYAEQMRHALDAAAETHPITGRFAMTTIEDDEDRWAGLRVDVELATTAPAASGACAAIASSTSRRLAELSSEYARLTDVLGDAARLHVRLREPGHPVFSARGGKQALVGRGRAAAEDA